MFTRIGHLTVRRRRLVLVLTGVGLVLAAVLGTGVFARLQNGGFNDPGSESTRATDLLEEHFGTGAPNALLVIEAHDGSVDSAESAAAGLEITELVAGLTVTDDTVSYWSLGAPAPLRSDDATSALVLTRFPGDPDDWIDALEVLTEAVEVYEGPVTIEIGGQTEVFRAIGETIEGDLARAESIAVPVTLVLLIIVFGGLVAALLPVAVGGTAVFGAFLVLYVVTSMTDVSIFSINLVTAMGLGLAIDYSLFVVSRFREELAAGYDVDTAVVRTVETAGRTVAFSAITVAISLSALLIFPLFFLRSFAYAGVGVVIVAMLTSVVSLPALLAVLGHRVDAGRILRRPARTRTGLGFWGRSATAVMKRPVVVTVVVVGALVAVGLPFLRVQFGSPDHRVLPESSEVRILQEELRTEFSSNESAAFPVVLEGPVTQDEIEAYAVAVSTLDGVGRVDAVTGRYLSGVQGAPSDPFLSRMATDGAAWISVVPTVEPVSQDGERLVDDIRSLQSALPAGVTSHVGGVSAELVDAKASIFGLVPVAALLIAISTFVLLFLMFGSVLVPLKAIVLNLLSLTATFGAMVWIFQDGNGAGFLDFTATGLTDTTTPILMFCIAFGLSMDYEVFLLSRVKEEYDRTGDNDAAVVAGLDKTGRIVTAAAVLLSVTFFAFATSGITFIKLFGLGLGIAVLTDAFVVRATLVPALMKLAGSANWWAPGWMRRIYDRFGLDEGQATTTTRRINVPAEPAADVEVPDDLSSLGSLQGDESDDNLTI